MSEEPRRSVDADPAQEIYGTAPVWSFLSDAQWTIIARVLRLSGREAEIVSCLLDDASEAEIADGLGISSHTVHTHVERLYRKLGVGSRCQLAVRLFAAYAALHNGGGPRAAAAPDADRPRIPPNVE
jgi:DNA-binding CsgD family transcriptional regulator